MRPKPMDLDPSTFNSPPAIRPPESNPGNTASDDKVVDGYEDVVPWDEPLEYMEHMETQAMEYFEDRDIPYHQTSIPTTSSQLYQPYFGWMDCDSNSPGVLENIPLDDWMSTAPPESGSQGYFEDQEGSTDYYQEPDPTTSNHYYNDDLQYARIASDSSVPTTSNHYYNYPHSPDIAPEPVRCQWVIGNNQICTCVFQNPAELTYHVWTDHEVNTRDFNCGWNGCNRQFNPQEKKPAALAHIRDHTGQTPISCQTCGGYFNWVLRDWEDTSSQPMNCSDCENERRRQNEKYLPARPRPFSKGQQVFGYESTLAEHVNYGHNEDFPMDTDPNDQFRCLWGTDQQQICNLVFPSPAVLRQHIVADHIKYTESLICEWEGKCSRSEYHVFSKRDSLTRHVDQHIKPFCCKVCRRRYYSTDDLLQHAEVHKNTQPMESEPLDCTDISPGPTGSQLSSSSTCNRVDESIHQHVQKAKPPESNPGPASLRCYWITNGCQVCSQTCAIPVELADHIRLVHAEESNNFVCLWKGCELKQEPIKQKYNAIVHLREHTGEVPVDCMACFAKHMSKEPYECSKCGKSWQNGKKVMRSKKPEEEGSFRCLWKEGGYICQEVFQDPIRLKDHIISIHSIDKENIKCLWRSCNRKLRINKKKEDFIDHLRYHTGEIPYTCGFCSEEFKQMAYMLLHEKNHMDASTNNDTKTCLWVTDGRVCMKTYPAGELLYHLKDVHVGGSNFMKCGWQSCKHKKPFMKAREATIHLLAHFGFEPVICDACRRLFCHEEALNKHKNHGCPALGDSQSTSTRPPNSYSLHNQSDVLATYVEAYTRARATGRMVSQRNSIVVPSETIEATDHDSSSAPPNHNLVGSAQPLSEMPETDGYYPCLWDENGQRCAEVYKTKNELRRHINKDHITKEMGIPCYWRGCSKICSRKLDFTNHFGIHVGVEVGEKPYKCKPCRMAFANREDYDAHQETHRNFHTKSQKNKKNRCLWRTDGQVCMYEYPDFQDLLVHLRSCHTKEDYDFECCWRGCESFVKSHDAFNHFWSHLFGYQARGRRNYPKPFKLPRSKQIPPRRRIFNAKKSSSKSGGYPPYQHRAQIGHHAPGSSEHRAPTDYSNPQAHYENLDHQSYGNSAFRNSIADRNDFHHNVVLGEPVEYGREVEKPDNSSASNRKPNESPSTHFKRPIDTHPETAEQSHKRPRTSQTGFDAARHERMLQCQLTTSSQDDEEHRCLWEVGGKVCMQLFPNTRDLDDHVSSVHLEGPVPLKCFWKNCTYDLKSFQKKNNVKVHIRLHTGEKPYECEWCYECFSHNGAFNFHKKKHARQQRYWCKTCGEEFTGLAELAAHKEEKHASGEPSDPLKNTCLWITNGQVCMFKCASLMELSRHVYDVHTGGVINFKCCWQGCEWNTPFKRTRDAHNHMAQHIGGKPFGCDTCPRRFLHECSLQDHKQQGCPRRDLFLGDLPWFENAHFATEHDGLDVENTLEEYSIASDQSLVDLGKLYGEGLFDEFDEQPIPSEDNDLLADFDCQNVLFDEQWQLGAPDPIGYGGYRAPGSLEHYDMDYSNPQGLGAHYEELEHRSYGNAAFRSRTADLNDFHHNVILGEPVEYGRGVEEPMTMGNNNRTSTLNESLSVGFKRPINTHPEADEQLHKRPSTSQSEFFPGSSEHRAPIDYSNPTGPGLGAHHEELQHQSYGNSAFRNRTADLNNFHHNVILGEPVENGRGVDEPENLWASNRTPEELSPAHFKRPIDTHPEADEQSHKRPRTSQSEIDAVQHEEMLQDQPTSSSQDDKEHRCLWEVGGQVCMQLFPNIRDLDDHVSSVHLKARCRLVCLWKTCGYLFTRKDSLKAHLRLHTGEKPYKCDECKKPFSHISVFKKHRAKHARQQQNQFENAHSAREQDAPSSESGTLDEPLEDLGAHYGGGLLEKFDKGPITSEQRQLGAVGSGAFHAPESSEHYDMDYSTPQSLGAHPEPQPALDEHPIENMGQVDPDEQQFLGAPEPFGHAHYNQYNTPKGDANYKNDD